MTFNGFRWWQAVKCNNLPFHISCLFLFLFLPHPLPWFKFFNFHCDSQFLSLLIEMEPDHTCKNMTALPRRTYPLGIRTGNNFQLIFSKLLVKIVQCSLLLSLQPCFPLSFLSVSRNKLAAEMTCSALIFLMFSSVQLLSI